MQGQSVYVLINSQVYALRATDGKQLWHANLYIKGTRQDSYSSFFYDYVWALDRNGQLLWKYLNPQTSKGVLSDDEMFDALTVGSW